jgi:transposase
VYSCFGIFFTSRPSGPDANHRLLEDEKRRATQIAKHARSDENARLAMQVRGIGPLSASALAASLGDLTQFRNGRQFGAWLGLVPRQRSSGGTQRLGRITKRGDAYLRKLLVLGARSALTVAARHDDADAKWALQLQGRVGWPKACVALANRNARTLWRTLARRNPAGTAGKDASR